MKLKYQKIVLLFCIIICFFKVNAQTFDFKSREINSDDDLLKTTTWVRTFYKNPSGNDAGGSLGTGYFFYSTKSKKLFLITNKHVVSDNNCLSFGANRLHEYGRSFTIDSLQDRSSVFGKNDFMDLVAIDIGDVPYFKISNYDFKVFTEKNIISQKQIANLNMFSDNLISLSYPGITMIPFPYQPYIIHCNFATSYTTDFQGMKGEFCISGPLDHGCSGSPIICFQEKEQHQKQYILLGTYFFTFSNYQDIDSVRNDTSKWFFRPIIDAKVSSVNSIKTQHSMTIGRAIKSEKLLELVSK